ncbi:MAG: hypothetical protein AUK03_00645 [Anaerolineae bacterium CG2_30_64_16]|nr:MAG: hypothetical protein AUK03_00645 [Anaerolineae bacterium CG2_30_64_16]
MVDPFAGSNITGEVAERLQRKWFAFELVEDYLEASKFRFAELYEQSSLFMIKPERVVSTADDGTESGEIHDRILQPALLESKTQYQDVQRDEVEQQIRENETA